MNFAPVNSVQRRMASNLPQMIVSRSVDESKFSPAVLDSFEASKVEVAADHPAVQILPEEAAIYGKRNATQAKKNPFIAQVVKDPAAFLENMKERFEAQKVLTPQDPYSFEFGDYGIPVLEDIDQALDQEIVTLKQKQKLEQFKGSTNRAALLASASIHALAGLVGRDKPDRNQELETGLQYLNDLKADIGNHIEDGSVSYRRLNELSYFSARALGHFDREDLSFFDRNFLRVDRHLLGFKSDSIETEYARYKDNDYRLFQKSAGDKGIELAAGVFEQSVFNNDKFELAALPVARSLGPGVFMQLLPHDIFLLGVSPEPEEADGFNRPGGDFYLHDARHSASIFAKRKIYEKEHNLSPQQIEKLEVMQSVWKQEMVEEKKKLEDKELSYAIGFLSFNHHHDRGIPQLPSSFIEDKHGGVADKLYFALKASGQPIGFKKPLRTLNKAYDWLQNFWLERLPQEEAILSASAR